MGQAIICTNSVSKQFVTGTITTCVLNNISVSFEQGHSYAITGASGSGKSTLLHLLAGIDTPTSGDVLFNDRSLSLFSKTEKQHFLNQTIGLVFQRPYLIDELTVLENVTLKRVIAGYDKQQSVVEARALLEQIGLIDKIDACPATLSGGQQQRVALARALLNRPQFIIADEPTGSLDSETGKSIIDVLMALCRDWHMGLIISSHDESVTSRMAVQLKIQRGQLEQKN